jgi:hypothetical protein
LFDGNEEEEKMASRVSPNLAERVSKLAGTGAELVRHRGPAAPLIAAKMLLARGLWGIHVPTFLMLGMYEQPMRLWGDSIEFGAGLDPVLRIINWQGDGRRLNRDKLITAERLAENGIAGAPLIAYIGRDSTAHPHGGRFAQWSCVDEIVRALPSCPDHLYVKPAIGAHGHDVLGPERCDGGWEVSGRTMTDRELAEHLLVTAPAAGWLLQERVRSHRGLAPIGGELGLGTVRINTALTPEGGEIFLVWGKILRSRTLTDNFSGGRSGNLIARVDKESGKITQAFGRLPGQRFLLEPVAAHPVTGTALSGFQLPLWDRAVALAKRVAEAFPESPLIGSDVAITDGGPLVIETNTNWDATPAELAIGGGLRPALRKVIPRLALGDAARQRALAHLALSGRAQLRAHSRARGMAGMK